MDRVLLQVGISPRLYPFVPILVGTLALAVMWFFAFCFRGWQPLQEPIEFVKANWVYMAATFALVFSLGVAAYKHYNAMPWIDVKLVSIGKKILIECTRISGSADTSVYIYVRSVKGTMPEINEAYRPSQENYVLPYDRAFPLALELVDSDGKTIANPKQAERAELRLHRPYGQIDPQVEFGSTVKIEFDIETAPRLRRRLHYIFEGKMLPPDGNDYIDPRFGNPKLTPI